jgi:hypothetical protein
MITRRAGPEQQVKQVSWPYAPECVEGAFCELRLYGGLGSKGFTVDCPRFFGVRRKEPMAFRVLMVLAVLAALYGCGQSGQAPIESEKEGGVEPKTVTPSGGGEGESQNQSHGQSHGQQAEHEQHPMEKACGEEPEHLRVFECEPLAMVGVVYDAQMQPERDRQTYEQALAHVVRVVPDELEIQVYFYSGEEDYKEANQNAVATVTVAGDYSVGQYGGTAPPLEGELERKDE